MSSSLTRRAFMSRGGRVALAIPSVLLGACTQRRAPLASEGSGKRVTINFCPTCGTKLFLGFERFPVVVGLYAGTFDDPNWFERTPEMSRHIFLGSAQEGTVIPAGIRSYFEHSMRNDGTPTEPTTFERPHTICQRQARGSLARP